MPENLANLKIVELEAISINEYHPLPDGAGKPTEVHLCVTPKGQPNMRLVLRFKGRGTLDQVVVALQKHADNVFGKVN